MDPAGLLSGWKWSGTTVTYSFPQTASDYEPQIAEAQYSFTPVSEGARAAVRKAMAEVETFTNLDLVELPGGDGQIRYGLSMHPQIGFAYAYYPTNFHPWDGDVWGKLTYRDRFDPPTPNGLWALLHETGHALGLKHPHEYPRLPKEFDSTNYTVMSYSQRHFDHAPKTFMGLDILALQELYGADFTYRTGNDTYRVEPAIMALWDAGGEDTLDFSALKEPMTITLEPGGVSSNKNETILLGNSFLFRDDPRSVIENAKGTKKADSITGNSWDNSLKGGKGNDFIQGGLGDDVLRGGKGKDKLLGGPGSDTFVFRGMKDYKKDKILDYDPDHDYLIIG